ncbi:MAG: hypothetical protein GX537_09150, partial [Actinobacteria bacterium]|nr:hypothetical protein [Actinomycetota bacterium]
MAATVLTVLILAGLLAVGAWSLFAWHTVDAAVQSANGRLDRETIAALSPDAGSIFSQPTTILVLGVDKRATDPGRSDSIL